MKQRRTEQQYVVCIRNEGCEDLELRKIYRIVPDAKAAKEGYLRLVDESGEDYLYPEDFFLPISLPQKLEEALALT